MPSAVCRMLFVAVGPLAIALLAVAADTPPHWAFQPVRRPAVPVVEGAANPVDAFVLAEQAKHGLALAPEATRRVLIRRLSLDLTGLPPSPEEVERARNDESADWYEKVVERLLASPHYGERWGRHWLDVARWAESEGYESNHPRPFAWRYRDYVVASFNADKPFDRFVTEQLAGDELAPYADEHLVATGFLAAARLSSNEEDKWLQRNQVLVDVVDATGSAFLGLTLSCAQCHNHKFDPVSLRDYYALMAYFLPGQPVNATLADPALWRDYESRRPAGYDADLAAKEATFAKARQALLADRAKELSAEQRRVLAIEPDRRTAEEEVVARQADLKFQAGVGEVEKYIPKDEKADYDARKKRVADAEKVAVPPQTWAFYSPVHSPHKPRVLAQVGFYPLPYEPDELARRRCYVHQRGDVHAVGPNVTADVPRVFDLRPPAGPKPGSRLELARWLTDPRHPLTARVWANRVWQYHFGLGLVVTADDFGKAGERPTHPELLDWLADELVKSGWSTKHLHRLIVTSRTYRQAAKATAEAKRLDPDNRLLTRWPIRRMQAETIRDVMLAASGELDRTVGGPSVPAEGVDASTRRGLYLFHRRGRAVEMQGLFDAPNEAAESCARRHTSTTALQALFLLNHPFTLARARHLAASLPGERDAAVEGAFLRVLGRRPDDAERAECGKFLAEDGDAARVRLCHALLNLNEAVYLE